MHPMLRQDLPRGFCAVGGGSTRSFLRNKDGEASGDCVERRLQDADVEGKPSDKYVSNADGPEKPFKTATDST